MSTQTPSLFPEADAPDIDDEGEADDEDPDPVTVERKRKDLKAEATSLSHRLPPSLPPSSLSTP